MAVIKIPAENIVVRDAKQVTAFLAARGIDYERWTPSLEVPADATAETLLAAYSREIATLKARGGYQTADVIDVHPSVPNLDAMLAKLDAAETRISAAASTKRTPIAGWHSTGWPRHRSGSPRC